MKMLLYKMLTQAIILLGRLRISLFKDWEETKIYLDHPISEKNAIVVCCDCAALHSHKKKGKMKRVRAFRPIGYDYGFRFGKIPYGVYMGNHPLLRDKRLSSIKVV